MLEFKFINLLQSVWFLVNFWLVYVFFKYYFYPKITQNLKNRAEILSNLNNSIKELDTKINSVSDRILKYQLLLVNYKNEKMLEVEKEIDLSRENLYKELSSKYIKSNLHNIEEINIMKNSLKTEEIMIKYAKSIIEKILDGEQISHSSLKTVYDKMKLN